MKRVLIGFLSVIILASLMGCGSGDTAPVGGKPAETSVPVPDKKTGKPNNLADASATPAPSGVKTGTPGG